nr:MAG TPA: hypothetical protein [Caudoviricetes sp.]
MNTNEITVEDVIKSQEFKGELTNQLSTMRTDVERAKNKILENGGLTRRVMLDRIDDMTVSDIIEEFEKILLKKSNLPAAVRVFIYSLCGSVFANVFSKMKQNEAKQDNNTGKGNE